MSKSTRKYPALGILFKGEMVRAIESGIKTQTRRMIDGDSMTLNAPDSECVGFGEHDKIAHFRKVNGHTFFAGYNPKYRVGEILYVKETWCMYGGTYIYRADYSNGLTPISDGIGGPWKPSLFMPYEAARIFLKVTGVRVERLNDISEDDAWAEGCKRGEPTANGGFFPAEIPAPDGNGLIGWDEPQDWYADLWEEINGEDSWDTNPFVWAYTFERTEKPVSQ